MFNRLLRDFPLHEWFEAADGCDICGAKYEVMIVSIDKEGVFGFVKWRITHKPDCPDRFNEETGEEEAFQYGDDVAGWEFMPEPFTIQGKQYNPLKSRANIGPCVNCGRLVIGVPLILFIEKGKKGELDFCFECVKRLGIMEMIKR
jgi:hypothetical protein